MNSFETIRHVRILLSCVLSTSRSFISRGCFLLLGFDQGFEQPCIRLRQDSKFEYPSEVGSISHFSPLFQAFFALTATGKVKAFGLPYTARSCGHRLLN